MEKKSIQLTDSSINMATRIAQSKVKSALDYADNLIKDPKKDRRLTSHFCKACFYAPPRIAGAAMTTCNCGSCGEPQLYSSTNTDILCLNCAKSKNLCKHCSGDINMETNRK